MAERSLAADRRGLSEGVALGVLVGLVLLTTGAVGTYVLVTDTEDPVEVNFTFQYFGDSNAALVTHAQGAALTAGTVLVEGPDNAVTWAELADDPPTTNVSVGDSVQLSGSNAYGSSVVSGDRFRIYRSEGDNRTELTTWRAGS